jgi:hypothetical protein
MQAERVATATDGRVWVWPVCLWAATAPWLWLPLLRPHGQFFWGRYTILDLFLGLPLAAAAVCATIVALQPVARRRLWAFRLGALWMVVFGLTLVLDLFYALIVLGAWKGDYWLDLAFIERRYSAPDAELGFVRRPNVAWHGRLPVGERYVDYRTDEHGFRNPPGLTQADLVFIGDSFTEAAQMPEANTFAQEVGAATGLRAVNLGRGAYGPQQELIVLRRYGFKYRPRAVIWQLFEGNDLNDAQNYAKWRQNPQAHTLSLAQRYLQNSLLQVVFSRTRAPERGQQPAILQFHDGERLPISLNYPYEPHQADRFPLGMAATQTALLEGQQLCQAQGSELLVVFVPIMARVLEPWLSFPEQALQRRYLPAGGVQQPTDTASLLADFCAQHGIAFVDAFEPLRQRAAQNNRGVYIPIDEHLDEKGHAVLAELIAAWLHNQRLGPTTNSAVAASQPLAWQPVAAH